MNILTPQIKKYLPLTLGLLATLNVSAGFLYFGTSGDDLVITAKEADDSAQYWSLTLTQAAALTPTGTMGSISEFYDLTGDSGSNSSFNIVRSDGLFFTVMDRGGAVNGGTPLTSHPNSVLNAPAGVDGSSSYSFTLSTTIADYQSSGTFSTFTSVITLNAPTETGTRFEVENTIVSPSNWNTPGDLSAVQRESRSSLRSYIQPMTNAELTSFNGWNPVTDANQTGTKTAVESSTDYATGRTFTLSQTAQVDTISTSPVHAGSGFVNDDDETILTQALSGLFRGSIAPDSTYSSLGFLDINILAVTAAVPEPSSYALILSTVLMIGIGIHRRRASSIK